MRKRKKLLKRLLLVTWLLGLSLGGHFGGLALGNSALACDQDSDGDGFPDCRDPCPFDPWNTCIYILWTEWRWETELLQDSLIQAKVGQVIPLDLILVRAPRGLHEFELHFLVGDSRGEWQIAKIKKVETLAIKGEFCRSVSSTDPEWQGFWVILSCEDEEDQVQWRERDLRVVTIELEALEEGSTYLWSQIEAIGDDHLPVSSLVFPSALKLEVLE